MKINDIQNAQYTKLPSIKSKNIEFVIIFLLSFGGIQNIIFPGPTLSVVIQFIFSIVVALMFIRSYRYLLAGSFTHRNIVILFLCYGVIVFAHSLFVANTYEQWRYLFTVFSPTLLLPIFCILGAQPQSLKRIFSHLITTTVPISFVFILSSAADDDPNRKLMYTNFVSFLYLFIIFVPCLKIKWKILFTFLSIISFNFNTDNRSNMLCIGVAWGILVFSYLHAYLPKISYFGARLVRHSLLIFPIIFLVLGGLGHFNVFKYIEEEGTGDKVVVVGKSGRNLTTDSRTSIYDDLVNNLNDKNDWIFGSSAVVIYKTNLADALEGYDDGRLGGSESGFVGLLTFGGLVYVVLFFLLCYRSSYLAIYQSNNNLIKMIGVFIAFRWFYSFVESPLQLNFNWITIFVSIGMALGTEIRQMTNQQISKFLYEI